MHVRQCTGSSECNLAREVGCSIHLNLANPKTFGDTAYQPAGMCTQKPMYDMPGLSPPM